jgi:hypothetical protein
MIPARDPYAPHARALWRLPNVIGVGVGHRERHGESTGEVVLTVAVLRKVPLTDLAPSERVPDTVGRIRTDVIEVGRLWAQGYAGRRTAQGVDLLRPGLSIGHPDGTAGTLGPLVERDGRWYWTSCNHVIARANDAHVGDPVLQPGPLDGGTEADRVGTLVDFIPLRWIPRSPLARLAARLMGAPTNLVDAALFYPDLGHRAATYRKPAGFHDSLPGDYVTVCGRTSGEVAGRIRAVVVTVRLEYEGGRSALFRSQALATGITRSGDSGAAVIDEEGRLAGMVIGGSDQATVITPIGHLARALRVRPVCASRASCAETKKGS